MAEHPIESMVNMMAAIEADMLIQRFGFYGAVQHIDEIEKFQSQALQSETLKTFENRFWERVKIFVEIKHPEYLIPSKRDKHDFETDKDWNIENP